MLKKIKEILNNQWVVNICAPLIVAAIPTVWISITQKVNLRESLIIIFNFIKDILNYKIPLWSILLFLLFVLVIIFLIISLKSKNSISREYPDWYYDFKTMNYKNWIFTWNYKIYYDKYEIENLRPICSCNCEFVQIGSLALECPNCKSVYNFPKPHIEEEVKRLIEYKIRTSTYSENSYSI